MTDETDESHDRAAIGGGQRPSGDCENTVAVGAASWSCWCRSTYEAISVEVDDSEIQYTTSNAVDGIPRKNGEANFDLGTPYAILEEDIVVVLIDGEWIEFSSKLRPQ
jgi:hypothetical protein